MYFLQRKVRFIPASPYCSKWLMWHSTKTPFHRNIRNLTGNCSISISFPQLQVFLSCHKFHTTQVRYLQCNTAARSRNHCCRGKAVSITCYEYVFVFLLQLSGIQRARAVSYCHEFGGGYCIIKYVFQVSLQLPPEISHSNDNSAGYYHKFTQVFMQSARYSRQNLMKLEFSRQIFGARLKCQS